MTPEQRDILMSYDKEVSFIELLEAMTEEPTSFVPTFNYMKINGVLRQNFSIGTSRVVNLALLPDEIADILREEYNL